MLSAKGLKNIPSKPGEGLQNKATRTLISLSQYIIKTIRDLEKKACRIRSSTEHSREHLDFTLFSLVLC